MLLLSVVLLANTACAPLKNGLARAFGCEQRCPDNDSDRDGVYSSSDNCPKISNEDQTDTDGDTVGNACDNCIKIPNTKQADSDKDGRGDACDKETLNTTGPATSCQPGGPCWITATFTFDQPTETICPNKYNIFPSLRDPRGNFVSPVYFHTVVGIPKDVCVFDKGDTYTVRLDLGERYPILTAGIRYDLRATYVQPIVDDLGCYPTDRKNCPDANACDPCFDLFQGVLTTAATAISITPQGEPIERIDATCSCEPAEWAPFAGSPVRCQISNLDNSYTVEDIVPKTIRLNGTAGIIPDSDKVAGRILNVQFNPIEAANSLGTPYPKEHLPEIQGWFKDNSAYFSAICPVRISDRVKKIRFRHDKSK
jgi:hypothetical protein